MEVTCSNFRNVLEELDDVLDKATFLAIDGEFTGLNSGPDAKPFDTPSQYYSKLRSGSMDFLLVQFGLSVFTHDTKTNKYSQRSYNFYVFPRQSNRAAPDCRFLCQASSISFLAKRGFDFNKLFKSGIPYLTTTEEDKLTKRLEEKQRVREDGLGLIPITDEDKPQIDEICSKIDEFLVSEAEELLIERCNGYIRRIVHQEARMKWPNKIRIESKLDGSLQGLLVFKMGSKEEEEKKEVQRRLKEKMDIKEAVGLTALLRKISESDKLIVGHNMLLDLCHMVHQFFGPLPEKYSDFKSLIHDLFPKLIDTKVISQSTQFKELISSTVLEHIFETIGTKPFSLPEVIPVEDRSYSSDSGIYHQAGYDAYITGLCFIALSNYLGGLQPEKISTVLPGSALLNPFMNKLLIVRLKDFPYLDLVGNDPRPSRDHVFHLTFPKDWKSSNISNLFNKYGGVYVSWLSDTTAYVGLNRRDQASVLSKKTKKTGQIGKCQIQSYKNHQSTLETTENTNTHVDRKRKQPPIEDTEGQKKSEVEVDEEEEGWEQASGNKEKYDKSSDENQNSNWFLKNRFIIPYFIYCALYFILFIGWYRGYCGDAGSFSGIILVSYLFISNDIERSRNKKKNSLNDK